MNNKTESAEPRVTVQEFAEISRVYKQQMVDAWCRVRRSASSPDFQQVEDILLQLIPSDMRFYAEKSRFWEEQIPRIEALLKNVSAEELLPVFHDAPAFYVWNLMRHRPNSLLEYLWSFKGAIDDGTHKLSKLQRELLLNLYGQTFGGALLGRWIPTEWVCALTPDVSRSLKRLCERSLILRQSPKGGNSPKRTTHVKLTHLGFAVTKRIWFSERSDKLRQQINGSLVPNFKTANIDTQIKEG